MIGKKMEKALNRQINAETWSAGLYFSMSAWFAAENLAGCASWMRVQGLEELTHAERLFRYLVDRGGRVRLEAVGAPPVEWEGPLQVFENQLAHERKVTGMIHELVQLARDEKDYATESMLRWFVDEQVEEEAGAEELVEKIKLVGDKGGALFMLDRELGERVFTPPVQE